MTTKIKPPSDLPKYDELMWPVIEALKELGGSASTQELLGHVVEKLNLSEQAQSFRRDGVPKDELYYRSDWTKWYLKKAGIVEYQDKLWSLTAQGRQVTKDQVKEIPAQVRQSTGNKSSAPTKDLDTSIGTALEKNEAPEPPEEDDEESWRSGMLEVLQNMHFGAFERLCQLILRKSGFAQVEVTGRTGDRGIDGKGVFRMELISFHVLFQCKRYKETVGSAEVRDFRGAMAGRTDKGLLLTTGRFTREAEREATREGAAPIELINGDMLCDLLKKLGIGTEIKLVEKVTINRQFFADI